MRYLEVDDDIDARIEEAVDNLRTLRRVKAHMDAARNADPREYLAGCINRKLVDWSVRMGGDGWDTDDGDRARADVLLTSANGDALGAERLVQTLTATELLDLI